MFSGEKTVRNAYSFWFLRICFRHGLAVAARPNTVFPPLISLEDGCHGRRAGLCVAGLCRAEGQCPRPPRPSWEEASAEAPSCPFLCLFVTPAAFLFSRPD